MDISETQCSREVTTKLIKWSVEKRSIPIIFSGSFDALATIAKDLDIPMHDARTLVSDKPERISDHSILFFKEQNTGDVKEQAKLYKLMLEREIGGYRLPENVSVVIVRDDTSDRCMPRAFSTKCFHVVYKDDNKMVDFAS